MSESTDHPSTCINCGKPCESYFCQSDKCAQFAKELADEEVRQYLWEVREGLKATLRERCKNHDDWSLNRLQRWSYTVKVLLCVALKLGERPKHSGDYPEMVTTGLIYARSTYAGWESMEIRVGRGCRGWWFEIEQDGEWDM